MLRLLAQRHHRSRRVVDALLGDERPRLLGAQRNLKVGRAALCLRLASLRSLELGEEGGFTLRMSRRHRVARLELLGKDGALRLVEGAALARLLKLATAHLARRLRLTKLDAQRVQLLVEGLLTRPPRTALLLRSLCPPVGRTPLVALLVKGGACPACGTLRIGERVGECRAHRRLLRPRHIGMALCLDACKVLPCLVESFGLLDEPRFGGREERTQLRARGRLRRRTRRRRSRTPTSVSVRTAKLRHLRLRRVELAAQLANLCRGTAFALASSVGTSLQEGELSVLGGRLLLACTQRALELGNLLLRVDPLLGAGIGRLTEHRHLVRLALLLGEADLHRVAQVVQLLHRRL